MIMERCQARKVSFLWMYLAVFFLRCSCLQSQEEITVLRMGRDPITIAKDVSRGQVLYCPQVIFITTKSQKLTRIDLAATGGCCGCEVALM